MGQKQSNITFHTPSIKLKDITIPLKKIYIPPPKPINKKDLRTSIGYIHDVVSIIPPLKLLTIGITSVADVITHGIATGYLDNNNKYNHTLDLIPGGGLMQRIANDSSNRKSGQFIDNKKIFVDNITNLASKKNMSSNDIKKTFFESILPTTTLQKLKREINNNYSPTISNSHLNNISNNHIINSRNISRNSNSSSSSYSNNNTINNNINKNNILQYENLDEKKQDDYTFHYIGIAFCTFIFLLQNN